MKGKVYSNKVEMYNAKVYTVFDIEGMRKVFKKYKLKPKVSFEDYAETCSGRAFEFYNNVYVVYINTDIYGGIDCECVGTIAHEAFHVIDFIYEFVGCKINEGSGNEHYAYGVGYLTQCITTNLHKYFKAIQEKDLVK